MKPKNEYKLTNSDIRYLKEEIINKSCLNILDNLLKLELNSSIDFGYGRPFQTISFQYKKAISIYYYILDYLYNNKSEDNKSIVELYINKLIKQHKLNLEYEIKHIPIIYTKSKKSITTTKLKAKRKDMFTGEEIIETFIDKSKKKTKEQKTKEKMDNLSNLISFSFNKNK